MKQANWTIDNVEYATLTEVRVGRTRRNFERFYNYFPVQLQQT